MRTINRPGEGMSHWSEEGRVTLQTGADPSRGLVIGWLRLAVASLMVAGMFSLLVAVARTSGIQDIVGEDYFRVSLVGHVTFSLNVWALSFAGVLWALLLARAGIRSSRKLGLASLWLAAAGAAIMAGISAAGLGAPSLVDYIPILEHPGFAIGLAAFLSGVGLGAINFLVSSCRLKSISVEVVALKASAWAYLASLATLAISMTIEARGEWVTAAWGAGHLLQVTNAACMAAVWVMLLPEGLTRRSQAPVKAALRFYLLAVLVVPLLYLLPGPVSMGAVGTVTWSSLAVPTVVVWLVVGTTLAQQRPLSMSSLPLLVSMLLFAVGGYAALMGLESDSRVTAHYHGTVGAVTVAFMGLSYRLLPRLRIRLHLPGLARIQPLLYGGGLLFLIAGLFWASNFGGQRKAFEAFAHNSSVLGPMGLFGAGALLAVAGGVAFVLGMGISLLNSEERQGSRVRYQESISDTET